MTRRKRVITWMIRAAIISVAGIVVFQLGLHPVVYLDSESGLMLRAPRIFRAVCDPAGQFKCHLALPWDLGSAILVTQDSFGYDEQTIVHSICVQLQMEPEFRLKDVCASRLGETRGIRLQYNKGEQQSAYQWHFFHNGQHLMVYLAGEPIGVAIGGVLLERAFSKASFTRGPHEYPGFLETPADLESGRIMTLFGDVPVALTEQFNTLFLADAPLEALDELLARGANINGCSKRGLLLTALERNDLERIEWLLLRGVDLISGDNCYPKARAFVQSTQAQELLVQYLVTDPRYRAIQVIGHESMTCQFEFNRTDDTAIPD
ncbi:MAG: hypothetical protein KDC35_17420 [Acidobacteria bacterium]|nr:hypothetical protein [Acidobacteriota bacterium]